MTFLSIKPLYSAQAIEARLWGLTAVKGAKTEDGKNLRETMWELFNDCSPGTILAEVKSGVNIQEFEVFQRGQYETSPDPSSQRGLALELFDAFRERGMNIGKRLVKLGLAKEEVREEKLAAGEVPYYVVRKETARCEPSQKLQLLRQHQAYLATRLDQFKTRALAEEKPEDSAIFEEIRQRIRDLQSKLQVIQERREKAEKDDIA